MGRMPQVFSSPLRRGHRKGRWTQTTSANLCVVLGVVLPHHSVHHLDIRSHLCGLVGQHKWTARPNLRSTDQLHPRRVCRTPHPV